MKQTKLELVLYISPNNLYLKLFDKYANLL